jgi:hypothetical protein
MEEFKLIDFFPLYTKNDNSDIFKTKREFSELKFGNDIETEEGFFNNQTLIARWMSPHTLYNRLLVFHGMGTGKTCVIAAVSELVLRQQYNPNIIILSPSDTLKTSMMEVISNNCGIKRVITKNQYNFFTYGQFAKLLNNKNLKELFNGSYIFIDEAHKLFPSTVDISNTNFNEPEKCVKDKTNIVPYNYMRILNLIKTVPNIKLMLLTGTPMQNSYLDIVPILNLINDDIIDINKFKDIDKYIENFMKNNISYYSTYNVNNIDNSKITLCGETTDYNDCLINKVTESLTPSDTMLNVIECGGTVSDTDYAKKGTDGIVKVKMSEDQYKIYKKYIKDNNIDTTKYGLCVELRQISNFVGPDGSFKFDKKHIISDALQKDISDTDTQDKKIETFLTNLKKYSAKYAYVIRIILANPEEKMFVYNYFVENGCKLFEFILNIGFKLAGKHRKCEILTGSTEDVNSIMPTVNSFNEEKNIYGENIQVLIGSHIVAEGINFKHIRRIFLLTPDWHMAGNDQISARGIRRDSHDQLSYDKKTVAVYKMASYYPSKTKVSMDEYMYKTCIDKDKEIKKIERIMKEVSWDCYQNNPESTKGINGNRICDYTECKYICKSYSEGLEVGSDEQTFNLFYGFNLMLLIEHEVKVIFSSIFIINVKELYTSVRTNIKTLNLMLFTRTLYRMVTDNTNIINKYGIINYLREENNTYFLSDSIYNSSSYKMAWYSENLIPNDVMSYETSIDSLFNNNIKVIYNELASMDEKDIFDFIKTKININIALNLIENILSYSKTTNKTILKIKKVLLENNVYSNEHKYKFLDIYKELINGKWELTTTPGNNSEEEEVLVDRTKFNVKLAASIGYFGIITNKNQFNLKENKKPPICENGICFDTRNYRTGEKCKPEDNIVIFNISIQLIKLKKPVIDSYNILPINEIAKIKIIKVFFIEQSYEENKITIDTYLKICANNDYIISQHLNNKTSVLLSNKEKCLKQDIKIHETQIRFELLSKYLSPTNIDELFYTLFGTQTYLDKINEHEGIKTYFNKLKDTVSDLKKKSSSICTDLQNWFTNNDLILTNPTANSELYFCTNEKGEDDKKWSKWIKESKKIKEPKKPKKT